MPDAYKIRQCNRGKYRWEVETNIGGVRKRKFFTSKANAEAWADPKNIELINSGLNAVTLSEPERVMAKEAMALLAPYGKTIADAVRVAIPIFQAQQTSKLVSDAVDELLKAKAEDGVAHRYALDMKSRLAKFSEAFGGRLISTIGTAELRDWLRGLKMGPVAKNNMRRLLSVLFSFSIESEWCDDNPAKKIKAFPKGVQKIGILTPEEAAKLLIAASCEFAPILAIGLFAGLRRSELERISSDSINLETGLIKVDVTKTKSAARRFVRIRPCLRKWLEDSPKFQAMGYTGLQRALLLTREVAKMERWPNNALRHSFCSYALEHEKSLAELSLEMGHTNPNTLFAHYRELCSPEDAKSYWSLGPEAAKRLAAQ